MTNPKIIFILGILLVILPLLGIPSSWKMTIVFFFGIYLAFIGYKNYKYSERHRLAREEKTKTYSESNPDVDQILHG